MQPKVKGVLLHADFRGRGREAGKDNRPYI